MALFQQVPWNLLMSHGASPLRQHAATCIMNVCPQVKSLTVAGNARAPDQLLYLEWVKKAWNTVTHDVILFNPVGFPAAVMAKAMASFTV